MPMGFYVPRLRIGASALPRLRNLPPDTKSKPNTRTAGAEPRPTLWGSLIRCQGSILAAISEPSSPSTPVQTRRPSRRVRLTSWNRAGGVVQLTERTGPAMGRCSGPDSPSPCNIIHPRTTSAKPAPSTRARTHLTESCSEV